LPNAVVIAILVAAGSGAAVAIQGPINSLLNRNVGLIESTFVNFVVGAFVSGAAVLLFGTGDLRKLTGAPLYSMIGGILGVLIVTGVVLTIQRLGVAAGAAALIVSQLLVAAAVDHYGLFGAERQPVSVSTFVGIGMLIVGAYLIRR